MEIECQYTCVMDSDTSGEVSDDDFTTRCCAPMPGAVSLPIEASNKLKRQDGSMLVRQTLGKSTSIVE